MLSMLLAYDADGNVVATLDYVVAYDPDTGEALGLVDFEAVEDDPAKALTDVWNASAAVGSGTWPEWIGTAAHDFKVTRAGGKITELTHKTGTKRVRSVIKDAIATAIRESKEPPNITPIVGSPSQPLALNSRGNRAARKRAQPTTLPLARRTDL